MGVSVLEVSIVVAVLSVAALVRAYGPIGHDEVARWARARGLELTRENLPLVVGYLRRARRLRTSGVIAGLLTPTVVRAVLGEPIRVAGVGDDGAAPGELGAAFVGYLVGAVCAESSVARPFEAGRRSAALLPRELGDYLPRAVLWTQRGLAAACVLGGIAMRVVPYGPSVATPSWASVAGFAAFLAGFAIVLERLELWIVRRPQPFVSASLLEADDAIRAQSVHSLAGAGVAFLLFACSLVAFVLASSDVEWLRRTMWLPGVAGLLLSVVACQYYGERGWRVRRDAPGHAAPT
jgi:hypothetical protein